MSHFHFAYLSRLLGACDCNKKDEKKKLKQTNASIQ